MLSPKSGSLVRRFSIIYWGLSVMPIVVLFYLYTLYDDSKSFIHISNNTFSLLLILVAVVSLLGFYSMQSALRRIALFSESVKKTLYDSVDEKVLAELVKEEGEIAELARSFGQILKRLENNLQALEEAKKTLHNVLRKVSEVLSSAGNFDNLIRLVLETSLDALGARRGALFSSDNGRYVLKARAGMENVPADRVLAEAQAYLELIEKEKRIFTLPTVEKTGEADRLFAPPLVVAPLIYRGKSWGALCLSGTRFGENFSNDDLTIISNLGHQIAVSFENAKLNQDAEQTYFETMAALAMAVEARDPYSRGHSDRVGEYAKAIAQSMGFSEQDVQTLLDASRLHDVGKIGITDSVLVKPGSLSLGEKEIMRRHPLIGESIVLPLKTFKHLLDPIRHHHEYMDGSGYPDGLRGEDITSMTRVLVVADIYDALTTDRPYRKAMNQDETKKELEKLAAEGKIDAGIVRHLHDMIDRGEMPRFGPADPPA